MRHEATEGRSVAAPVQGGRAAGHGGAQRGCARTGGQGSRARRGAARLRPYRGGRAAGHGGAQRGCARTGGAGQQARRGAARLRPYRGRQEARGERGEAWFTKGVVNVPSANTTRERNS
jgi:hypothetical protein